MNIYKGVNKDKLEFTVINRNKVTNSDAIEQLKSNILSTATKRLKETYYLSPNYIYKGKFLVKVKKIYYWEFIQNTDDIVFQEK